MTSPSDPNASRDEGFSGGPASDPGQGGYGAAGSGPGAPGGAPSGYPAPPGAGQGQGYGGPTAYGAPAGYPPPSAYAAGGASTPFGRPGAPQLAGWGDRAVGFLIDYFGPALLVGFVSIAVSSALANLLALAAIAWGAYNGYLQGQTGQSYGKKVAGTRLLREQDGQLLGGGAGVGRFFLHILDALPCYVGFLWPLWDSKKQTFADKIIKTVVVKA